MFLRYVTARAVKESEDNAFKNYVADGIKILTENAARADKSYLTLRLYDLLHGKAPEQEKTAEEIIAEIRAKVEGD